MAIERWELSPSSQPDRYLLKVRGPKADVDKIVQAYNRVCHEPREMGDAVYQWAVYVVGATINERLAIQDSLRDMMVRPADAGAPAMKVDLSGVLSELTMMLEGLTGLTEEEQAHVAKKMEQIQQREAQVSEKIAALPPAPEVKPPAPPAPVAAPAPVPPAPVEAPKPPAAPAAPAAEPPKAPPPAAQPPFEIVRDVARAPLPPAAPPAPKPAAPPPAKPPAPEPPKPVSAPPPAPKVEPPAAPPPAPVPAVKPPAPPLPVAGTAAEKSAAPPPPPSATTERPPEPPKAPAAPPAAAPKSPEAPAAPKKADVPSDQLIQAVCFFAPGAETVKDQFIKQLTEVAQKKAKKPMTVQFLRSEPTKLDNKQVASWIQISQAAGAECAFVLLSPDVLPDFLETAVVQMRQAGVHCLLIPQDDIDSRILYVDLMVELLLVKRKK